MLTLSSVFSNYICHKWKVLLIKITKLLRPTSHADTFTQSTKTNLHIFKYVIVVIGGYSWFWNFEQIDLGQVSVWPLTSPIRTPPSACPSPSARWSALPLPRPSNRFPQPETSSNRFWPPRPTSPPRPSTPPPGSSTPPPTSRPRPSSTETSRRSSSQTTRQGKFLTKINIYIHYIYWQVLFIGQISGSVLLSPGLHFRVPHRNYRIFRQDPRIQGTFADTG